VASFHDFALVCQALDQIGSRAQMAELAGELLARLEPDEAAIAARFMAGNAIPQGEEKRLRISGRAIWRIVAATTGGENQGEEIFAATSDLGEAIEMLMRTRTLDPEPSLTLAEVNRCFLEIAGIEGRGTRRETLDTLRELFERASALEGKYLAKILMRGMRYDLGMTPLGNALQASSIRKAPGIRHATEASERAWDKIKNARTLNLVIVAAEWGRGRRHGLLSNYHLAARDEHSGKFVEIAKTSKGLTSSDRQEMTERLRALQTSEADGTVTVRPEIVVEVVYSDIQRSAQYAGGMELRMARIAGVRGDKSAEEADTIATVAAAFEREAIKPGADGE